MNIEFCHLSHIEIADIISLLTNDRVLKHMPLAKDSLFDEKQCLDWVKEKQWQDHGYGPWAFLVDNKFAGWGGLQYENGDADLALVLHPQYWGFGKKIFNQIIRRAFNEMGMESITILLPPTRNKLKRIYLLGFEFESEIMLSGELFIKYRLYKPSISNKMI